MTTASNFQTAGNQATPSMKNSNIKETPKRNNNYNIQSNQSDYGLGAFLTSAMIAVAYMFRSKN